MQSIIEGIPKQSLGTRKKWKIHYYAHLESTNVSIGEFVSTSQTIGAVGNSGNAKGKPPHLHYSVVTLLPYFLRWDNSTQGWKKMFFLNPSEMLLSIYSKV